MQQKCCLFLICAFVSYLCFCFLCVLNTLMVDLEAQEVTGKEGQERDNKVLVGGARV